MNPTQVVIIAAYGIVQALTEVELVLVSPTPINPWCVFLCMCLHRGAETTASLDAFSTDMTMMAFCLVFSSCFLGVFRR